MIKPLDVKMALSRAGELAMKKIIFLILLSLVFAGCDPYKKGHDHLNNGEYELAAEFFLKKVEENPEDPRAHNELGYSYARLKMYDDAIKEYNQALILDPNYFEAELNLGTASLKLFRYYAAIEHLSRAAELDPKSEAAHANLAWAYYYIDEFDEAREHTDAAEKLSSGGANYSIIREKIDFKIERKKKEDAAKKAWEEQNKQNAAPEEGTAGGDAIDPSP